MNFEANTLWINDNLPVLRGMDSGTVDLIYLDPPFNSKGGGNELANLQLLCAHCNSTKGAGTMHDLRHRLAKQVVRGGRA